jgi:hypothetical protein
VQDIMLHIYLKYQLSLSPVDVKRSFCLFELFSSQTSRVQYAVWTFATKAFWTFTILFILIVFQPNLSCPICGLNFRDESVLNLHYPFYFNCFPAKPLVSNMRSKLSRRKCFEPSHWIFTFKTHLTNTEATPSQDVHKDFRRRKYKIVKYKLFHHFDVSLPRYFHSLIS